MIQAKATIVELDMDHLEEILRRVEAKELHADDYEKIRAVIESYVYLTQAVGDLFMSLIHTCELCEANPFDYLAELERHADRAAANPRDWLPWNYRETLDRISAAARQAITDATYFDKRDINRNFPYDYEAYSEVKRKLGRLIDLGQLRLAMTLSLELMDQGSHQVEMSDEGLMTDDIEECLQVVMEALPKCDLPPGDVVAWCRAMLKSDRVGCICDRELRSLQCQFEGARS